MRRILTGTTLAVGLTLAMAGPAAASDADVIDVPGDFVPALSDTRSTGHYDVVGTGLRVWTEGTGAANTPNSDKVAEYVATSAPLASVGEPTLNYTVTSGTTPPGFQLVVDFDDDGTPDGILVGEPTFYGDIWWLNNAATSAVKGGAPKAPAGTGSEWDGTLDQWRVAFPDANVVAFGFSLGSGVTGDGVISSIDFAGTRYTFTEPVVLASKDECKNGGWATSTDPVYKNQGQCVSAFASDKAKSKAQPTSAPTKAATAAIAKAVTKIWPFA